MATRGSPKHNYSKRKRSSSVPKMLPSEMDLVDKEGPIQPMEFQEEQEVVEPAAPEGLLDVEEHVEDIITLENETALFECKVVQDLKPTCTWHKDGCTLQSDDERILIIRCGAWHRLEITHVTTSDQGLYTIECRHEDKYISVKCHLYVAPRKINDGAFYHTNKSTGGVLQHLRNIQVQKGQTITMHASFAFPSQGYSWFKNNDIMLIDRRTSIESYVADSRLTITNARLSDTGVYYIVTKTDQGYLSSFADVLVGDVNEMRRPLPLIEEILPTEIDAIAGEEVRLIAKVISDEYTGISWDRNCFALCEPHTIQVEFGCDYYGLIMSKPDVSSTATYRLVAQGPKRRAICTTTKLKVQDRPPTCSAVLCLGLPESAMACCGAKVSFDCRFDLKDPIYYFVVWYVGHYKVERTNSHFNVISHGGHFLLYIKKFEPSMAGDVICELRRSYPKSLWVTVTRVYASLVMLPLPMIQEAKSQQRPVLDGKLYYEKDAENVTHRIQDINREGRGLEEDVDYFLKIIYCKLDHDGLFFMQTVRGSDSDKLTRVKAYPSTIARRGVVIEWSRSLLPRDVWFCLELGQANGTFTNAGYTSRPSFTLNNPPIDRMMSFRIRVVPPVRSTYSEVLITPPPEMMQCLPIPHEIQPMEAFNTNYSMTSEIIGTGAFGKVALVKNNKDGSSYAAKIVKARTDKKKERLLKEFSIMKSLRHPKLIELIGFYESRNTFVFVMEYCWGGELFDRVASEEYLKEGDVVGYVKQICEGLQYMHMNGIVHLDLKPENIICISPNSREIKLIDFGVARNVNEDYARAVYGTRDYVAPEIIDYEQITTACDMWSMGVVTYTLMSGLMPFNGNTWMERSVNITRASYDYDDAAFSEVSDLAKNFVDMLLIRRPDRRMTAGIALRHKWIVKGPPQGTKAKNMNRMRHNMKSYLADYRARWQRAGNVMIAAHRLRMRGHATPEPPSREETPELPSREHTPDIPLAPPAEPEASSFAASNSIFLNNRSSERSERRS